MGFENYLFPNLRNKEKGQSTKLREGVFYIILRYIYRKNHLLHVLFFLFFFFFNFESTLHLSQRPFYLYMQFIHQILFIFLYSKKLLKIFTTFNYFFVKVYLAEFCTFLLFLQRGILRHFQFVYPKHFSNISRKFL